MQIACRFHKDEYKWICVSVSAFFDIFMSFEFYIKKVKNESTIPLPREISEFIECK